MIMNKQKLSIIILSILAMLCSFLPWVQEFGYLYKGTEMDGWITLALFGTSMAICLGGNSVEPLERKFKVGIYASSGLATIIGSSKILKSIPALKQYSPDWARFSFTSTWNVQLGLYSMVILGLIILMITSIPFSEKSKA